MFLLYVFLPIAYFVPKYDMWQFRSDGTATKYNKECMLIVERYGMISSL